MNSNSYWERTQRTYLSRRRIVTGGTSLALGTAALALIGCGDDEPSSTGGTGSPASSAGGTSTNGTGATGSTGASGQVSAPVDTTSEAAPGGMIKHFALGDPSHFDPLLSANADVVNFVAPFAYQRLLKWSLGTYPEEATGTVEGQAATGFEVSPDRLTLTLKLRQGMSWDDASPTNGRAMNAQDVLFSWNKFATLNQLAGNVVYNSETAPNAPVESITAPDDQTVVFHLARPDSRMIPYLTAYDYFNVMPIESDSDFDPRRDVRGNGPWRLEEFEPSVRLAWQKNPNYYVEDRPFPDRIEMPIIPDYAQRLAQFKSGEIYTSVVTPEDVIQTKQDVPDAIIQSGQFLTGGGGYVTFGFESGTPWHDVRMRQALSMSIDREAYANAIDNRDVFAAQGLDLELAYNSIVYAGWPGAYLDPTSSEFGDSSKYLTFNPEEGKKLVAAAGYEDGLEFDWVYSTERYGALYLKQVEVLAGMFPNVGLMPNHVAMTYTNYQDVYSEETYWDFPGVVHRAGRGWPSLSSMFSAFMLPGGTHYHGALADEGDAAEGDPRLTDMVFAINQEFDTTAQQALIHDLIRYYTERTYSIMRPSNPKAFTVTWPVIGNHGLNTSYPGGAVTDPWINWWIDQSKPPAA